MENGEMTKKGARRAAEDGGGGRCDWQKRTPGEGKQCSNNATATATLTRTMQVCSYERMHESTQKIEKESLVSHIGPRDHMNKWKTFLKYQKCIHMQQIEADARRWWWMQCICKEKSEYESTDHARTIPMDTGQVKSEASKGSKMPDSSFTTELILKFMGLSFRKHEWSQPYQNYNFQ